MASPYAIGRVHAQHGYAITAEFIGQHGHLFGIGFEPCCLVEILDRKRAVNSRAWMLASHGFSAPAEPLACTFLSKPGGDPNRRMPSRRAASITECLFGRRA
jgi:hypothetical protein